MLFSNFNQEVKIIAPVADTTKTINKTSAKIDDDSTSTVTDDKKEGVHAAKKPLKDPKGKEPKKPQN